MSIIQNVRRALLLLVVSLGPGMGAFAQDYLVKGTVLDKSGEPLIGAAVQQKGTSRGVITDLDGNFEILVDKGSVLVFSCLSYISQELEASPSMSVVLMEDNELLDEVVVVGYGVQRKSSVTGSISSVKSLDVENRTINSAQEALQGKTSGVQVVTTSGIPGSTPNIRVRGYSSNSDMSPLFVVDGIIMADLSNVDPSNIESMEVLKDASSAAIYGAQAGNGVVLITTKRGTAGSENWGDVKYDFQFASHSVAHAPHMMNAKEYAEFQIEAGAFDQTLVDTYWDKKTDTDWFKEVFEPSARYKHTLSFSNGNDRGAFYTSLSYLSDDGFIKGDEDKFTRINGTINADYKIKPWLKLSTSNNLSRSTNRGIYREAMTYVFQMDPLTPMSYSEKDLPADMRSLIDSGNTILQDKDGNYYSVSSFFGYPNPLASNASQIDRTETNKVSGNLSVDLTPFKGFTFTSKLGYDLEASYNNIYTNDYYGSAQRNTPFASVEQTNRQSLYYQWDNYVNYLHTFGRKHDLSVMVGHSFTKKHGSFTKGGLSANGAHALQVDDPDLFGWLDFAAGSASKTNAGVENTLTSESYFGRINYSYDGKYMAQVSLRADAFDLSKLPLTNRWGYFPATSLAWVISRENFWQNMPSWFGFLKARASWGKNGSIGPLAGYLYSTNMSTGGNYAFGDDNNFGYVTSSSPSSMGNEKLSWETSTQLNFGLDARLFDDRLVFSADYFNKATDGLLVTGAKASLIAGGVFSPMNAGSVLNRGFEFELGWQDNIGDLSYSVRSNLSTLSNKVTSLNESIPYLTGYSQLNDPLTVFEKGNEVWHFYGYKYIGLDKETGEPQFEDLDSDGVITADDRTNIGSAIPRITYGITFNMAYKGFDFVLFGSGTAGNQIYQALFASDRASGNRIYEEWYTDRWSTSNKTAVHPAANADISRYRLSSAMVKDGSFFKVKQIQLGYSLPKQLLKKVSVTGVRVYASLDDFFTFTSYTGFDPESSSASTGAGQGVDVATYPISKKMVFGVNINF